MRRLFAGIDQRPLILHIAALAAGACYPLAFAPYEWRIFAFLSPMVLFHCWRFGGSKVAALRGFLFGLGVFGVGAYWIYYSLTLFGDAIAPLAAVITVGFVAFFACYFAVLGWLVVKFLGKNESFRNGWMWPIIAMPAAWTLCELFRGWFLTGFPWLSVGYSQIDSWLAAGYAPILGVYGVGWMVALCAGGLLVIFTGSNTQRTASIALLGVIWVGGYLLGQIEWSEPHGEPLKVRIVQGNIEQHQKFMADMLYPSIDTYTSLSESDEHVDLIVWPESAIPTFFNRIDEYLSDFTTRKAHEGTKVLTGGFIYDREAQKYYNSLRMLDDPEAYYHKQHLVPFGEYLPFRSLLSFLSQYIVIPMADLSSGEASFGRISVKGQQIASSICYEDAFGEEVIQQLPEANLLLNISNDSWFGDSAAPYQHLEIARMRSLETSRPMVRVTNTGVSSVIDHNGIVRSKIQKSKAFAINAIIQPRFGRTLYVGLGNRIFWIFSFATLLLMSVKITLSKHKIVE